MSSFYVGSVADVAPSGMQLTDYDRAHAVTYLRLLDAAEEGADWREVVRIVLEMDPEREPERSKHAYDTHLARARWLSKEGYREFLREPS